MEFDNTRAYDVIALGRSTCDIYSQDIGDLKDSRTFLRFLGGSPANTAAAMSKLKLKVGFIGKVSDDGMGQFVIDEFHRYGVNTDGIAIDDEGHLTGITIGELKGQGKCSCLMYRNNCADLNLKPQELSVDYIKNSKILLISGTSLSQSPAREAVLTAANFARKYATKIMFDPDFREGTWKNNSEASIYLALCASMADIVVGTVEEMEILCRGLLPHENFSSEKIAKALLDKGVKIVVIKNGKKGSTAYTAKETVFSPAFHEDKILKTFGAGDSFASGFVHALLMGKDLARCQTEGAAAAAVTIKGNSCSEAAPTLAELEDFLNKHTNS